MEQALKERLVGAVVLVGIAVLLIPELLSGRKPAVSADDAADGARTYTIELQPPPSGNPANVKPASEQPGPARSAGLTLPAPTDEPVAQPVEQAVDEVVDEAVAEIAPQSASDSASSSASVDTSVASAPAAPGGLAVQVGAFGSEDAANRMVRELQSKGFDAYLSPVERGGKTLQRVRVGPARDAATATATAERLKQLGYGSAVVVGP
jgi:DedD protein